MGRARDTVVDRRSYSNFSHTLARRRKLLRPLLPDETHRSTRSPKRDKRNVRDSKNPRTNLRRSDILIQGSAQPCSPCTTSSSSVMCMTDEVANSTCHSLTTSTQVCVKGTREGEAGEGRVLTHVWAAHMRAAPASHARIVSLLRHKKTSCKDSVKYGAKVGGCWATQPRAQFQLRSGKLSAKAPCSLKIAHCVLPLQMRSHGGAKKLNGPVLEPNNVGALPSGYARFACAMLF